MEGGTDRGRKEERGGEGVRKREKKGGREGQTYDIVSLSP